ncbi:putative HTH-type transcriptional regulator YusO [Actinomadura rubteroloni]|uniref:Putative HTH-type transcriptional regulator YusO n=1 Tax=Actinomadura rubteroloni TaxID=1926885 RepID=A0A2P4URF7_9ACTN|nr:MarR family transcriptional regulator [Actinomadura rubteroloni]POM27632.1 putative HTH-type transcriptional regulator YusO [Actinomadura rubteroloni]
MNAVATDGRTPGTTPDVAPADLELSDRLRNALGRLHRRARRHTPQALTVGQVSTLAAVESIGPVRLVDLADHEGVRAPTQSRVVATLEDMSLLARTADPADRRACLLTITDEGRAWLDRLRADRTAFYATRIAALPPEQRAALAAALPALEALAAP